MESWPHPHFHFYMTSSEARTAVQGGAVDGRDLADSDACHSRVAALQHHPRAIAESGNYEMWGRHGGVVNAAFGSYVFRHSPSPQPSVAPSQVNPAMAIKQCSACERIFTKAEHLKRHERSRKSNENAASAIRC